MKFLSFISWFPRITHHIISKFEFKSKTIFWYITKDLHDSLVFQIFHKCLSVWMSVYMIFTKVLFCSLESISYSWHFLIMLGLTPSSFDPCLISADEMLMTWKIWTKHIFVTLACYHHLSLKSDVWPILVKVFSPPFLISWLLQKPTFLLKILPHIQMKYNEIL